MIPGITGIMAGLSVVVSAPRWRVRYIGTEKPDTLTGAGPAKAIAELMFMTSAGAGAQPGSGTAITSSSAGSPNTETAAFDSDGTTYWLCGGSDADTWLGYAFGANWPITHVSITVRASFQYQGPRSFLAEYSLDGGSSWILARYLTTPLWTSGATRVFALYADGYASQDLSAFDEVGGYRYYAIKNTGTNYAGTATCNQAELVLKKSGSAIQTTFHRNRSGGISYPGSGISYPFDGEASGNFFTLNSGSYVMIDFGYKRVVDQVGVTVRVGFASQSMKTYELYGGNTDMDITHMSLLKSVNDTGGTPASGATVLFNVP